jgi:hypothetical protein
VTDGTVVFHELPLARLDLAIDASRCKPINQQDCETYPRFMVSDFCGKLAATGAFYDKFLDAISPRLHCPLKTGSYSLGNATLDLDILKAMPLQGFRWRAEVRLIEEMSKEVVMCADIVLKIDDAKPIRRRRPRA